MPQTAPVTSQPVQWMAKKVAEVKCPPGMEILAGMTSIHLKQKIDMLEVITGWQVKNKFRLTDPETGQIVGFFREESTCCQRQCCKNGRTFTADIVGENDTTIFKLTRPCHCMCFCCTKACDGFCGQEITVLDSRDQMVSQIRQLDSNCCICLADWILSIPDESGSEKYRLENGVCKATCCEVPADGCCNDKYLHINDANGSRVGEVVKKWRGCATECCTPADALLITFPDDARPQDKAAIIGAVLLSDYNLWEQGGNNN